MRLECKLSSGISPRWETDTFCIMTPLKSSKYPVDQHMKDDS